MGRIKSIFFIAAMFISCKPNNHSMVNGKVEFNDGIIYAASVNYDFGKVNATSSDIVNFCFTLHNLSGDTLTIDEIEALCPCISIGDYERSVGPKHDFMITGVIKLTSGTGDFNKPLFVRYNNGKALLLRLKGYIE